MSRLSGTAVRRLRGGRRSRGQSGSPCLWGQGQVERPGEQRTRWAGARLRRLLSRPPPSPPSPHGCAGALRAPDAAQALAVLGDHLGPHQAHVPHALVRHRAQQALRGGRGGVVQGGVTSAPCVRAPLQQTADSSSSGKGGSGSRLQNAAGAEFRLRAASCRCGQPPGRGLRLTSLLWTSATSPISRSDPSISRSAGARARGGGRLAAAVSRATQAERKGPWHGGGCVQAARPLQPSPCRPPSRCCATQAPTHPSRRGGCPRPARSASWPTCAGRARRRTGWRGPRTAGGCSPAACPTSCKQVR